MRLCSYDDGRGDRVAALWGDRALAIDELVPGGPRTMAALLAAPRTSLEQVRSAAEPRVIERRGTPVAELRLLPPVPRPGKVVAIGRNYREHAAEQNVEPPRAPLVFAKFPTAVIGPGAEIHWDPGLTAKVDYEAELAVVIGRTTSRVSRDEALDYVLGFTCLNDVSARDIQFGDGQWTRGKSLDTFCPMGPSVVTGDEIGNAADLAIRCFVNGEERQSARTSDLYFGIAEIISHCSRSFTLEPGDVIATGTPGGVGVFRDPPVFLADGDEVVVEIEGIGRLVNRCRADVAS
ncbi:MAG TPA: fumarylacetoacetate hydrolase family protein [Candidatus Limnocylindrales bacterium]|nr:fumarylacetoacetate hydrolase family protein [Candidatus Limnocylindrales bacterium]